MRILVYGFGPYRQFRRNITARIIRSLTKTSTLTTKIFSVRFQRRPFIAALERHRPDVVLGLGQSSRKHMQMETTARNRRRNGKRDRLKPIFKKGPKVLQTTLRVPVGAPIRRSRDAGDYVCNYSMYVFLDAIARQRRPVRFGFIHIPYDSNVLQATRLVQRVLRHCRAV